MSKMSDEQLAKYELILKTPSGGQLFDLAVKFVFTECRRARAAEGAMRNALEGITQEFESTAREADWRASGQKGMHVPFFGDFAAALQLPSFCSRARWWARELRAALTATEGGGA